MNEEQKRLMREATRRIEQMAQRITVLEGELALEKRRTSHVGEAIGKALNSGRPTGNELKGAEALRKSVLDGPLAKSRRGKLNTSGLDRQGS